MIFQVTLYTVAYVIVAFVAAGLSLYVWERRAVPGGAYFSLFCAAIAGWSVVCAFQYTIADMSLQIQLQELSYIGVASMSPFWLMFALEYSKRGRILAGKRVWLIWILPIVTILLALTNTSHHLVWTSFVPSDVTGVPVVSGRGIFSVAIIVYNYLLIAIGFLVLIWTSLRTNEKYFPKTIVLLTGACIPLLFNFAYLLNLVPVKGFDATPLAFALVSVPFSWSLFGRQTVQLMPVAMETLVANMVDGVLVINRQEQIVDINQAAMRLLDYHDIALGKPIDAILATWPKLADSYRRGDSTEVAIAVAGVPKWVEMSISPLLDTVGKKTGKLIILRDITGRKQIEGDLRQSEERYRLLAETAEDFIYVVNPDMTIAFLNQAGAASLGGSPEKFIGKSLSDVFPPETYEHFSNNLKAIFGSGTSMKDLHDFVFPGKNFWLHVKLTPIKDRDGRVVQVLGISRDITDRMRAEEALRENEEKYRNIVRQSSDGIMLVDQKGNVAEYNEELSRITGVAPSEWIGRPLGEFIYSISRGSRRTPELRERMNKMVTDAVNRGINPWLGKEFEFDAQRPDGELKSVHMVTFAIDTSRGKMYGSMIRDITERKQAEMALRESEAKFRSLIEQSAEGFVLVDEAGKVVEYNKAAEKVYGYSREDVLGMSLWEMAYLISTEEDRQAIDPELMQKMMKRYLATGKNFSGDQYRETIVLCKDGSRRYVQTLDFPVKTAKGYIIGNIVRDISERKMTEDALRESETKFRSLIEQSVEGFILIDETGKIVEYNKAAEQIYGYTADEIIGMWFWDMANLMATEEERKAMPPGLIEKNMRKYLATGKNFSGNQYREIVAHCKDGSQRYIQTMDFPVKTAKGYIIGNIVSDITERKQAEMALRESEAKFRSLIEQSAEGFVLVDETGKIVEYNKAAEKVYGYSRDEVIGMRLWEMAYLISTEEDRKIVNLELIKKSMEQYLATGQNYGSNMYREAIVLCKDGSPRYVQTLDFPVKTAKGYIIGNIVSDISERKKAEMALRESEEKFRVLSETAPAAIGILQDGKFQYLNPAAEAFTGYGRNELMSVDFMSLIHPDFKGQVAGLYGDWLLGRIKQARFEIKIICKGGSDKWVDMNVSNIDYRGRPGLILIVTDTTERKHTEEKIKASLKEKEFLLKEIHHRVKNNLQVIVSLLSLQSKNIINDHDRDMFIDSKNRVKSMAMIHEKLYQSKDMAHIDFSNYIQELASYLFNLYNVRPGKISLKTNLETVFLSVDIAVPCGLAVNELISNCLKHAFPGDRSGTITVDFHRSGEASYVLSVTDDGVGLPPNIDFRNTTSLGMQLVNILGEQLDGKVDVISGPTGTCINLSFTDTNPN